MRETGVADDDPIRQPDCFARYLRIWETPDTGGRTMRGDAQVCQPRTPMPIDAFRGLHAEYVRDCRSRCAGSGPSRPPGLPGDAGPRATWWELPCFALTSFRYALATLSADEVVAGMIAPTLTRYLTAGRPRNSALPGSIKTP